MRDSVSPVSAIFHNVLWISSSQKNSSLKEKNATSPILTPAETKISVLLSALVKRFGVSRMRDFYIRHDNLYSKIYHKNIFNMLELRPTGASRTLVSRHLGHLWIVFCPKWAITITEKRTSLKACLLFVNEVVWKYI